MKLRIKKRKKLTVKPATTPEKKTKAAASEKKAETSAQTTKPHVKDPSVLRNQIIQLLEKIAGPEAQAAKQLYLALLAGVNGRIVELEPNDFAIDILRIIGPKLSKDARQRIGIDRNGNIDCTDNPSRACVEIRLPGITPNITAENVFSSPSTLLDHDITVNDIRDVREFVQEVVIPAEIRKRAADIFLSLLASDVEGLRPSTFHQFGAVIQASAWLGGRKTANKDDILALKMLAVADNSYTKMVGIINAAALDVSGIASTAMLAMSAARTKIQNAKIAVQGGHQINKYDSTIPYDITLDELGIAALNDMRKHIEELNTVADGLTSSHPESGHLNGAIKEINQFIKALQGGIGVS